jgi:hypothetical protein
MRPCVDGFAVLAERLRDPGSVAMIVIFGLLPV